MSNEQVRLAARLLPTPLGRQATPTLGITTASEAFLVEHLACQVLPEAHGAGHTFGVGGGRVDYQGAAYGLCRVLAVGGGGDRLGDSDCFGGRDGGDCRFGGWDVDHVDGRRAGAAEEQKRVDRSYHEVGERHQG